MLTATMVRLDIELSHMFDHVVNWLRESVRNPLGTRGFKMLAVRELPMTKRKKIVARPTTERPGMVELAREAARRYPKIIAKLAE